jgi:hypothetical protein
MTTGSFPKFYLLAFFSSLLFTPHPQSSTSLPHTRMVFSLATGLKSRAINCHKY